MKEYRGTPSNEYHRIHSWLRKTFGKANKCENIECNGQCKRFEWALLKGKVYSKDRDSFIMMCKSCHIKYDFTEDTYRKMSDKKRGENNNMFGVSITGKDHHFFGKHHSLETRKLLHLNHAKLSPNEVDDLKTLHQLGIKQSVLSEEFKISRASVCRIVNNKRYLLCQ